MLRELSIILISLGLLLMACMVRAQAPPEIDLCKDQLVRAHAVYDEVERRSIAALGDQQKRLAWWADCAANEACWEWLRRPANG